jgi:hypothetical protein
MKIFLPVAELDTGDVEVVCKAYNTGLIEKRNNRSKEY